MGRSISAYLGFYRGWYSRGFEALVPIEVSGVFKVGYQGNPREVGE